MSLIMYEVKYENLHYTGSLGEKELDFLESFRSDDGTFYIDEEILDENKDDKELPQELINFLYEKVKESEYGDLIIAVS